MRVLIDPYMFELTDETEIRNNIYFFRDVIKLARNHEGEKKIAIALYQGMLERMESRFISFFPLPISKIQDSELKDTVVQLNRLFRNVLQESIEGIEIDGCDGEQEFLVNNESILDDRYFELFSMLLIPCYSENINFDDRILTGNKVQGGQIGEQHVLECGCEKHKYLRKCRFAGVEEFISAKERVVEKIKQEKKGGKIVVADSIEVGMGVHHNHVQASKKEVQTLADLSTKNKNVLRLLGEVGLFKIIFGKFTPTGMREVGSMGIQSVREEKTQDILIVKFSAETGMVIETFLYFQKGMGKLLYTYFQNEQMLYKNVSELIEKTG